MGNAALVLVVEDHEVTRETLAVLFEKEGFQVRGSGTIREAADSFNAEPPDVVIVDVGLPDGNGLDLVESFVTQRPEIPVIVVTASDLHGLAKQALKRGAFCFIHKPYGFRDVLSAVNDALKVGRH